MTDFAEFERAAEQSQEPVVPVSPLVRIGAAIGDLSLRIFDRGADPVNGIQLRKAESDRLLAELDDVVARLPQSSTD